MSDTLQTKLIKAPGRRRDLTEPAPVRWLLTGIAVLFLGLFLLLPLAAVFAQALEKGLAVYLASLHETDALAAIRLTLWVAAINICHFSVCGAGIDSPDGVAGQG
jgi:ABC-type sulfate transport system permease subunit